MSITGTLIIQMIVFLILVGFTMKFVWPPIAAALDERARKIGDGLAAADKAKAELAAADRRVEKAPRHAKRCASKWLRWPSRVPSRSCARKSMPASTPSCSTA